MRQNTPPWLTPQPREKTSDAASTLSKAQRLPKQKRSLTLCCKTNTDASEHHTLYSLAANPLLGPASYRALLPSHPAFESSHFTRTSFLIQNANSLEAKMEAMFS